VRPRVRRQVADGDGAQPHVPRRHLGDHPLEVSDVPGVLPTQEVVEDRAVDLRPLARGSRLAQEVARERYDVLAAVAQRGRAAGPRGDAVVEVAAEGAATELLGEVAVRRAHQPELRALPGVSTDGFVRLLLHDSQEPSLERQGQLPHFVEEQGAAVGQRKRTLAGSDGAGESTALVTEELATRELRDDGRAVQDDEVPLLGTGIENVDEPRDELLAGSALSDDQRRGVGEDGHLDDLTQEGDPSGAHTHQVVAHGGRADQPFDRTPPREPRRDLQPRATRRVPGDDFRSARIEERPGLAGAHEVALGRDGDHLVEAVAGQRSQVEQERGVNVVEEDQPWAAIARASGDLHPCSTQRLAHRTLARAVIAAEHLEPGDWLRSKVPSGVAPRIEHSSPFPARGDGQRRAERGAPLTANTHALAAEAPPTAQAR